jgi:hypothetical protein
VHIMVSRPTSLVSLLLGALPSQQCEGFRRPSQRGRNPTGQPKSLRVWPAPTILTVTPGLLATIGASELVRINPDLMSIVTVKPGPAAATAAIAAFHSNFLEAAHDEDRWAMVLDTEPYLDGVFRGFDLVRHDYIEIVRHSL